MKPSILRPIAAFVGLVLLSIAVPALADTVTLKDGSIIHGKNLHIANGVITITTSFAGDVAIKQDQVASFETDAPVFVKTKDKPAVLGKVERKDPDIVVSSPSGTYITTINGVKSTWVAGAEDPEVVALRRRWIFEISTDIAGKSGNSTGFAEALGAVATLKTPTDALKFYASANHSVANGTISEDDYKGGIEYNAFFSPVFSWFVSTELMQDNVKDISLRSSTLAGIGYNAIRSKREDLQFRGGLSYRYETYDTAPPTPNFSSAGLNLALVHRLDIAPWLILHNTIGYMPSFQDFNNFVLNHDSNVTMPFAGTKAWSLRLGVSNEYVSKPVDDAKRLDTLYYLRFVYNVQ
jgi:hypothetical protein